MDDNNLIMLLDKIKKNLERGAVPIAIADIDAALLVLQRHVDKAKGKRFQPMVISQMTDVERNNAILQRNFELTKRFNEIVFFLNERFPLH